MVQRSHRDDTFKITQKVCGKKGHKIQMNSTSDVEKVEVVDSGEFCLSDQMVLRLAEIGVVLEKLYGSARDIEWAVKGVRNVSCIRKETNNL